MSGPRKLSTSLLSVLLSSTLVAAPVVAQDDFALPEGDFELPEGDFEEFDAEPEEKAAADKEPAAPKEAAPEKPPVAEPEPSPPAEPEADEVAEEDEAAEEKNNASESATEPETAPTPAPSRPLLERTPLTATETVELETELPPESDEDGAMFLITTGIGTALGVAVLAGLGVGGAILFGDELGPKGSVTVTPR